MPRPGNSRALEGVGVASTIGKETWTMRYLSNRAIGVLACAALISGASSLQAQTVGTVGSADPPAVLWKDPGPIASRDLFWGMGSAAGAPKGPFTFVETDSGGTQPKVVVTDTNGETWEVKFGEEAKAEVAANRLVWALGFGAEEMYFVKTGVINGAKDLGRVKGHIAEEGNFMNARFRRRHPQVARADGVEWTIKENPFVGRRELSGLMILMTMVANWDIDAARNNRVLHATQPDGAAERWFAITDLGATFGRMGGKISKHTKWNLSDYQQEGFIEKVEGDVVHLDYDGYDSGIDRVPLEHAKWFASLVTQLTPEQVRRAFEAAGASPAEVDGFSKRFLEKIDELKAAVAR
jgi:hypothetical protein